MNLISENTIYRPVQSFYFKASYHILIAQKIKSSQTLLYAINNKFFTEIINFSPIS